MSDIRAVFWKEWRELLEQFSSLRRGGLAMLLLVAIFGVMLPWQMGLFWLHGALMLGYWPFAGSSLVVNVIVDAFAGERERHTLETLLASPLTDRGILLGKYFAAASHGVAIVLLNLVVGLVTVNLVHGGGRLEVWEPMRLFQIVLLTILGSLFIAGIGVIISLRASSARQAHQTFGIAIIAIILTPAILVSALPAAWERELSDWSRTLSAESVAWRAALLLLALNVLALAGAQRRFRRGRLTLD